MSCCRVCQTHRGGARPPLHSLNVSTSRHFELFISAIIADLSTCSDSCLGGWVSCCPYSHVHHSKCNVIIIVMPGFRSLVFTLNTNFCKLLTSFHYEIVNSLSNCLCIIASPVFTSIH